MIHVFLLLALLWTPSTLAADQGVDFNCDRKSFPEIRQRIYKDEAEMFKYYRDPANRDAYPHGDEYDYCLAVIDVNNDGRKDIFRYGLQDECGSGGCGTDLLIVEADGKWREALTVYTVGEGISITDKYQNGHKVLKILLRVWCTKSPEKCKSKENPNGTTTGNQFYPFYFVYQLDSKHYEMRSGQD